MNESMADTKSPLLSEQAIGILICAGAVAAWCVAAALLWWMSPNVSPEYLPLATPSRTIAVACAGVAAIGVGTTAALLWKRRAGWPHLLLPALCGCALTGLLAFAAYGNAAQYPLAFAAAAAALVCVGISVRLTRRLSLAAALCLMPALFVSGGAAALLYVIAMMNA